MATREEKITWASLRPELSETMLDCLEVNNFIMPTPVQVIRSYRKFFPLAYITNIYVYC